MKFSILPPTTCDSSTQLNYVYCTSFKHFYSKYHASGCTDLATEKGGDTNCVACAGSAADAVECSECADDYTLDAGTKTCISK